MQMHSEDSAVIVDVRPVALTAPYGMEGAQTRARSAVFVEVETADGLVGVGETYLGVYMPEVAVAIVDSFRPMFVGRNADNPNRLWRDAQWATSYVGRTGLTVMVLGAIECALWDLRGKRLGQPVHELLGGAVHDRLRLYASGGVPTFALDQLVENTRQAVGEGFTGYKMRANPVTYQPEVEVERVCAVRDVLGPDRLLAVDAVQNFNLQPWTVKQVVRLLDALAPAELAWAEEFLPPFDPSAYAALRSRTDVHISGGEGITTSTSFAQWIRAGAFDIAQPDPTIIGGLSEARRACEYAAFHDVKIAMHVWGSGPTLMANYHLGFTIPGCFILEYPFMKNPLDHETLVEPLQIENGSLLPPTAPGLGVALTDDIKANYPYIPGSASAFG